MGNRSLETRRKIIKMLEYSRCGHLASALSLVEILQVLYDDILKYDSKNPKCPDRDRFILSKGHGCLALYAILSDKGFFPEEELWKFSTKVGILGGHPSIDIPGVEAYTGSLGHGSSIGLGFAINARYEKKDYKTFVLIGDGESNEGSIWEAAMCASKHKLDNLVVIVDCNGRQSYGTTNEVQNMYPIIDKWKAFGFAVKEIDGHNVEELLCVFKSLPFEKNKPSVVICNTVKGKGIKFIEDNPIWHHKSKITDEEIKELYKGLEE